MSALSLDDAQQQFIGHLSAVENAARYAFRRMPPAGPRGGAGRGLRRRLERLAACSAGARTRSKSVSTGSPATRSGTSRAAASWATPPAAAAPGTSGIRAPSAPAASRSSSRLRGAGQAGGRVVAGLAGRGPPGRPGRRGGFRLDFAAWLGGLPEKKRRVAELLAEGHEGVVVARLVGIAQSRVCQLRTELAELAGVPGASLYP